MVTYYIFIEAAAVYKAMQVKPKMIGPSYITIKVLNFIVHFNPILKSAMHVELVEYHWQGNKKKIENSF